MTTKRSSSKRAQAFLAALLLAVCCMAIPAMAAGNEENQDQAEVALQGQITNAAGMPVPECRVVARVAEGSDVFISLPSDKDGRYEIPVPVGGRYKIVALVSPTGGRVAVDTGTLEADSGRVDADLRLPMPVAPQPRRVMKDLGGVDRMFLSFVEDPALALRQHWEAQAAVGDFDGVDRYDSRLVAAFQFPGLPRAEFGLRGGFRGLEGRSFVPDDSGISDLDVWAKVHAYRSTNNRTDLGFGALLTFPTGDPDSGLGDDAVQSKVFVTLSYAMRFAALIAHAGVRTADDGERFGLPLEGEVSPAGGVGLLFPFSTRFSMVLEAKYDGERFKNTEAESQALVGLNWRVSRVGVLRFAVAGGLEDGSPDSEIVFGYTVRY